MPSPPRGEVPRNASERDTLIAQLNYLREAIVMKVEDLDREPAVRSMVASGTSLLGLVKHLAWVEHWWFEVTFAGQEHQVPWRSGEPEEDFTVADDETVDELLALYRRAVRRSNEIVADTTSLQQQAARSEVTLRWILVHMLAETARHAGHADILRERIDGTVGE